MRFLLDESADFRLKAFLETRGHDVTSIVHDYPRSISDPDVHSIAIIERRVLITNDRDFGEMIVRDGLPHVGVILFRLRTTRLSVKIERLTSVLDNHAAHLSRYIVVSERNIRVI